MVRVEKNAMHYTAALRRAMWECVIESNSVAPRLWLEALEPRLMFSKLAAALDLNASFGNNGMIEFATVRPNVSPPIVVPLAAAQDGKFYALSEDFTQNHHLQLLRFNANGTIDRNFAQDGRLAVSSGIAEDSSPGFMTEWFHQLWIQPDGKLLIEESGVMEKLLRFNVDGSPDNGFGYSGGTVVIQVGQDVSFWGGLNITPSIWLRPDGKISVVGYQGTFDPAAGFSESVAVVQRFNSDGTPDTLFSPDGKRLLDAVLPQLSSLSIAFETNSQTLSDGGTAAYIGFSDEKFVLRQVLQVRFDANDNVVSMRSVELKAATSVTPTIQPDGQLLLLYGNFDGSTSLSRIRLDGTIDPIFGVDGTPLPSWVYGNAVVQQDGKIVLKVSDTDANGTPYGGGIQRLNSDGSPDNSFAGGQPAFSGTISDSYDQPLVMPDGSVIFSASNGYQTSSYLVRVNADGGIPNAYLAQDPPIEATPAPTSGDPLDAATLTAQYSGASTSSPYQGLFAIAPGTTLFNPDGSRKVFDDGSTY